MAVKLNGETARTKPSSGRYSMRLGWELSQKPCEKTRNERALPCTRRIPRRLLRVKLFDVLRPKTEKVRKLESDKNNTQPCLVAGRWRMMEENANLRNGINFCLPNILPLSEDGGRHQLITVLFADEIRGLEKYGGSVTPWHRFPPSFGCKCALDGHCDSVLVRLMIRANMPHMVRRNQLLGELACLDLLNNMRRFSACQAAHVQNLGRTGFP